MGATKAISHTVLNSNILACFEISGFYNLDALNQEKNMWGKHLLKELHVNRIQIKSASTWLPFSLVQKVTPSIAKKFWVFHGTKDRVVPVEQADLLIEGYGIPSSHCFFDDAGHITESLKSSTRFLIRKICLDDFGVII
jgi:hypothetical protein